MQYKSSRHGVFLKSPVLKLCAGVSECWKVSVCACVCVCVCVGVCERERKRVKKECEQISWVVLTVGGCVITRVCLLVGVPSAVKILLTLYLKLYAKY